MARVTVDNSGNIWPESKITIADLAANTPILKEPSEKLNIYQVEAAMSKDWSFEIAKWEYEYCTGYSATFKDGSVIHIGAWADGEENVGTGDRNALAS